MKTVALSPRELLIPDSAVTLPRRPIVLPDIADEWEGHIVAAWRVKLLGKAIERPFVMRHLDAWTVAVLTLPKGERLPLAEGMDSTVTVGEWQGLETPIGTVSWQTEGVSGQGGDARPGTAALLTCEEAVERVSRTMTLKTGDIVVPQCLATVTLRPGRIRLAVGGKELLNVRILG